MKKFFFGPLTALLMTCSAQAAVPIVNWSKAFNHLETAFRRTGDTVAGCTVASVRNLKDYQQFSVNLYKTDAAPLDRGYFDTELAVTFEPSSGIFNYNRLSYFSDSKKRTESYIQNSRYCGPGSFGSYRCGTFTEVIEISLVTEKVINVSIEWIDHTQPAGKNVRRASCLGK